MARDSYAILGLGRARSAWFGDVAAWTTSGAIPASLTKCLSPAEVRQRLSSLQPWSVVMIDADFLHSDSELLRHAADQNVPTIVVSSLATPSTLTARATAVISAEMNPTLLLTALVEHATVLTAATDTQLAAAVEEITAWTGTLISVCGPGGTGASTVAMASAQGLSSQAIDSGLVALVDFARNSELAMLNDIPDVVPSVEDLVDAHRSSRPAGDEIRSLTYDVPSRGYSLLLGTRKPSAWAAMPPRAVAAAMTGLRRSFRYVVADITADFEGESTSGSTDIEERNGLARTTALQSDLVLAVGRPGVKGIHGLARIIRELIDLGVPVERILPVVSCAPKSPITKSEISKALAALVHQRGIEVALASPLFLQERNIEGIIRDGAALPKQLVRPLLRAIEAVVDRGSSSPTTTDEPIAIKPGELGLHAEAVGE